MDFIFVPVPEPMNMPPRKFFATINGTAQEFQQLIQALEAAMHGAPQVIELPSAGFASYRIIVDRLGPSVPTN